ncbi:MAG: hypothetical protein WBQ94_20035 [Terracidiphilus sp.]
MTTEAPNGEPDSDVEPAESQATPSPKQLLPLPGLAAIGLYLLVLAAVIIFGVVGGRHYPPLFLLFSVTFIAASAGLLRLFRWAWSLALSAVLLLVIYNLWIFSAEHQAPALVQSLLNLVFFLYLVRPEVRRHLR